MAAITEAHMCINSLCYWSEMQGNFTPSCLFSFQISACSFRSMSCYSGAVRGGGAKKKKKNNVWGASVFRLVTWRNTSLQSRLRTRVLPVPSSVEGGELLQDPTTRCRRCCFFSPQFWFPHTLNPRCTFFSLNTFTSKRKAFWILKCSVLSLTLGAGCQVNRMQPWDCSHQVLFFFSPPCNVAVSLVTWWLNKLSLYCSCYRLEAQ